MPGNYKFDINCAASIAWPIVPEIWIEIDGPLAVGQAMGVMGLTYSTLLYSSISLMVKTKEGQTAKVQLA